MEKSRKGER